MDNKLVMISIAAVIGIIVLGSVLMPILDDATATTDTFTNDGLYRMEKYDTTGNVSIHWDYDEPMKLIVGDKTMDLPDPASLILRGYTLVGGSTPFMLRLYTTSSVYALQVFDSTGNTVKYESSTSLMQDMDITINAGTVTFDNGSGATLSETYTDFVFFATPNGSYVMKNMNDYVYINEDSEIYGNGRNNYTFATSVNLNVSMIGSIADGMTFDTYPYDVTVSDVEFDYSEVSDHIDLYKFKGLTFVMTDDESNSANGLYTQIVVPYEVTAERSVHFTAGQNAIFAAIPVLIILAVLLGVVALVIRSRMD